VLKQKKKKRKKAPHAPAAQSEDEEDLHSGSADDSDEHRSDVEIVGTSQDELPPAKEQGKVTKVCPFYLSNRTPNLWYLD
jgi:hypothetical protein